MSYGNFLSKLLTFLEMVQSSKVRPAEKMKKIICQDFDVAQPHLFNEQSETGDLCDFITLHRLSKPLTRKKTQKILEVLGNGIDQQLSLSLSFFLSLKILSCMHWFIFI